METQKIKNSLAKSTMRAWIMGLIMLVSFIVLQIILTGPENYNRLTKQTDMTYVGFRTMITIGFILSVSAFMVLNFFKGMTKSIYNGYIALSVIFPLTFYMYLILGVNVDNVWKLIGIIALTILILLQSFLAGRTVRNSVVSTLLLLPSIGINMFAINIFFFAWKMV